MKNCGEEDPKFSKMSGSRDGSFPSFSRRPQEDQDSLASMRERMDRDREAFFADRPTQGRPFPSLFQVGKRKKRFPVILYWHSHIFDIS